MQEVEEPSAGNQTKLDGEEEGEHEDKETKLGQR